MTELACQGASYPAMIRKAENQGTALELLAPETHRLNSNWKSPCPRAADAAFKVALLLLDWRQPNLRAQRPMSWCPWSW